MSNINKTAYPMGGDDQYVQPPHNIQKWIQDMRAIYSHVNKGMDFNKAFELITNGWEQMDKQDFKKWMSFYQQGNHLAYKKADYDEVSFIPKNDLRGIIPGMPSRMTNDESFEDENNIAEQNEQAQKLNKQNQELAEKVEIDAQIRALIGRLNSAERIATTRGIDKVLGPVYENWMRALHDLKREIQVAPFRTAKSSLLEDLIIRKGNQLAAAGFDKSAKIMYKLAQVAPPPLEGSDSPPAPTPPSSPTEDPTAPIPEDPNLPSREPDPMPMADAAPTENKDDAWAEEFLKGLSGLVDEKNDIQDINDKTASDTLEVSEDDLVVYAQEAAIPSAPAIPATDSPSASPTDAQAPQPLSMGSELDTALSNVTVDQIVQKLEAISNIFKNREISRQLAMVDIMMDQLGIASYFGQLSEATAKALESNQYCGSRVEDILSRLKGSISTPVEHEIDLTGEKPSAAEGNAVNLKNQLQQDSDKDDARKKAKETASKAQEDAAISGQTAPAEVNTQELAQPTEVQAPPKPGIRV